MKDIYGHLYVTQDQIKEYEVKFDGTVRFLEYKNKATQEEMSESWGIRA